VLQYAAVCCSALQCVAVCCTVAKKGRRLYGAHCVVFCCSVLQCVAVCCSVLQCAAVYCKVLQCVAVCCRVVQGRVITCIVQKCCIALQCVAVCCSVLQCGKGRSLPVLCRSVSTKELLITGFICQKKNWGAFAKFAKMVFFHILINPVISSLCAKNDPCVILAVYAFKYV